MRTNAIVTLLIGCSLYIPGTAAAAQQPSGHGVVALRPSLSGAGAMSLVGHGNVGPSIIHEPTDTHPRLIVEDSLGNSASLRASPGSFWAEASTIEIDAMLAVVDDELDEILANYDAALEQNLGVGEPAASSVFVELDTPLCAGCSGLGVDVQHENAAVVELLENLYVQQIPPIELAYDFTRYMDYNVGDLASFYTAMQGLADFATYSQIVRSGGTFPISETSYQVTITTFNIVEGDIRSGAVWETQVSANGTRYQHQIDDNDIDNDGIRNDHDSDKDGDGWPNWLDADRDGDGVYNWNDADPDNPHEQCYPKQHLTGLTGFGQWFEVTEQNYLDDMAVLVEWELANFLTGERARVLVDSYARGELGMTELLNDLDLAYVDSTAGSHPVFASARLYAWH